MSPTPLQQAINNRYLQAVLLLLSHGATVTPKMLQESINDNYTDLAELLLSYASEFITTEHFITAGRHKNIRLMRLILDMDINNIDINSTNEDGDTLLYSVCALRDPTTKPMIMLLLENKINANIYNTDYHEHIIFRSIYNDELEIVKLLLKNDPDTISLSDHFNRSPLYHAALYNKRDIVELLLANGSDPNYRYKKNANTPIEIAIHSNNHVIANLMNMIPMPL